MLADLFAFLIRKAVRKVAGRASCQVGNLGHSPHQETIKIFVASLTRGDISVVWTNLQECWHAACFTALQDLDQILEIAAQIDSICPSAELYIRCGNMQLKLQSRALRLVCSIDEIDCKLLKRASAGYASITDGRLASPVHPWRQESTRAGLGSWSASLLASHQLSAILVLLATHAVTSISSVSIKRLDSCRSPCKFLRLSNKSMRGLCMPASVSCSCCSCSCGQCMPDLLVGLQWPRHIWHTSAPISFTA